MFLAVFTTWLPAVWSFFEKKKRYQFLVDWSMRAAGRFVTLSEHSNMGASWGQYGTMKLFHRAVAVSRCRGLKAACAISPQRSMCAAATSSRPSGKQRQIRTPRGMRDWMPQDCRALRHVIRHCEEAAQLYGFGEVTTAVMRRHLVPRRC